MKDPYTKPEVSESGSHVSQDASKLLSVRYAEGPKIPADWWTQPASKKKHVQGNATSVPCC